MSRTDNNISSAAKLARHQPPDALRPAQAISSASVALASTSALARRASAGYLSRLRLPPHEGSPWIAAISFERQRRRARAAASARRLRHRTPLSLRRRGRRLGDAALNAAFEAIFQEQVATSPTFATSARARQGRAAPLRSSSTPAPSAAPGAKIWRAPRRFIARLEAVPAAPLSHAAALNREVVLWDFKTSNVGPERFDIANPQSPYVISQQDGAYFSIPTSSLRPTPSTTPPTPRPICRASRSSPPCSTMRPPSSAPGRARLPRPRLVARPRARTRCGSCALQPAADSTMVTFARQPRRRQEYLRRLAARAPRRSSRATSIRRSTGRSRRAALAPTDRAGRRHLARAAAATTSTPRRSAEATTTSFTADEIHQIGLQQVAEISAELDTILRSGGLHQRQRRRAPDGAQQVARPALSEHRRRPRRADRRPQRQRRRHHAHACRGPSTPSRPSRSISAGSRPKSRTARRTAITARPRSTARARRSISST